MGGKKIFHGSVLTSIVGVDCDYMCFKIIFNSSFEFGKNGKDIRFMTHRIKPDIFGKMINKDDLKSIAYGGRNGSRSLNISVD